MADAAMRFDDGVAYERFMGRWSRAVGRVFLNWLAPPAGAHWLDVGCGTGALTELVLDTCSPAAVSAVDPAKAQIDYVSRQPVAQRADFRVADALALPFLDATFDVVTSAIVINFIPDRPRALAEMRRVGRFGGIVAGYVWDFAGERGPNWPLRLGMREIGAEVLRPAGADDTALAALSLLFASAGFEEIATRSIDVSVDFQDFDDFWRAHTPNLHPTTKMIAELRNADRSRLIERVRAELPPGPNGSIAYSARANAVKAHVPG
jgi:ubiquinone/menaquinone biosynthesis C-methylase UbiE